jgi:hypothetical protein
MNLSRPLTNRDGAVFLLLLLLPITAGAVAHRRLALANNNLDSISRGVGELNLTVDRLEASFESAEWSFVRADIEGASITPPDATRMRELRERMLPRVQRCYRAGVEAGRLRHNGGQLSMTLAVAPRGNVTEIEPTIVGGADVWVVACAQAGAKETVFSPANTDEKIGVSLIFDGLPGL